MPAVATAVPKLREPRESLPVARRSLANSPWGNVSSVPQGPSESDSVMVTVNQKGSPMYPRNTPETFAESSSSFPAPCPLTARNVARKIIESERGYHGGLTKTFHQLASESGIAASTWEYWWSQPPGKFVRFGTWRKLCEYHYMWACRRVRLAKKDQLEAIALRGAA